MQRMLALSELPHVVERFELLSLPELASIPFQRRLQGPNCMSLNRSRLLLGVGFLNLDFWVFSVSFLELMACVLLNLASNQRVMPAKEKDFCSERSAAMMISSGDVVCPVDR